ncbi:MAG TPA: hypothetical protein VMY78_17245 [Solirubrobacteraceae bacterium]|nr:hypothetical protein [Solirubrobacteraceae bacterium]
MVERRPELLETDPERGYERVRRSMRVSVPLYALSAAVIGFVIGGWAEGLVTGAVVAAITLGVTWLFLRRVR